MIIFMLPLFASADAGPKPSVVIDFKGFDGEPYFATLLAKTSSTGPYSAFDESGHAFTHYVQGDENFDIFLKFLNFKDTDGFYFLQYFNDCSETNTFKWTYYPPQEFKVLLYFPATDSFLMDDEVYERYAFDSYFTAVFSGNLNDLTAEKMTMSKSHSYMAEGFSFVVRVVFTIAVELGVALLFGLRQKNVFQFIVTVNIITQIVLNLALNLINFYMGAFAFVFFYILLELAVFGIEAVLYSVRLKKEAAKSRLVFYAFTANVTSFVFGMLLAYYLPGIF